MTTQTIAAYALVISAMGFSGIANAQTHLKWAHVFEPTDNYHVQAMKAAAEIDQLTRGRVRIDVIPASKAGSDETYSAKLKNGDIDMSYLPMSQVAKEYPGLGITGFPFIFQDIDHVRRYLASKVFEEQRNGYEKATGNHVLSAFYYGARHVTSNRFLAGPQDMAGIRLRVPGAPSNKLFGEAMKAQVVAIPFAKVYDALKSGEAEAQENPLPTIFAKKFYEVQKYTFLTAHIYDLITITVSQKTWQSLSVEDQKIMATVTQKAASWINIQTISSELTTEDRLRALGMKVVAVDRKAFKEFVLKNVAPTALGSSPGDYEQIQSLTRSAPKSLPTATSFVQQGQTRR
jgi:tripartite ATP-independent transporter DctP family solute receptor